MTGWRNNALGLQRWEVMSAHEVRLHATEAIADLMRHGRTFTDAKAEIGKRARLVYRFSRPELFEGYMRMVEEVKFSDMPKDIGRGVDAEFLDQVERQQGKPLGRINRLLWRWFGVFL
jgi:hypothetical protein